jgi:lipopolysaccharide/colanic/teichoic acid biosynthesis glycosyltransferase
MYIFFKRLLDIIGGTVLFIISFPIILATAVLIRCESKGSPFFFQTRIGLNGKPFRIFKLRGMYIDARQRFPELYDYSENTSLDFHFHYEVDPRVTKTGQIIRKYSIDELPNFANVMLGDMSLVGPRPEIPDILQKYEQFKDEYISVKPGITCASKISGRDTLTKRETIELDLDYIRNRTFVRDLKILLTTFQQVILKKDVF